MRISDWSSDVCSSDLDAPSDLPAESVMHLEVDEQGSAEVRERIAATLAHVLREVRETVADWRPMCDKVNDLVQVLKSNPPPLVAPAPMTVWISSMNRMPLSEIGRAHV